MCHVSETVGCSDLSEGTLRPKPIAVPSPCCEPFELQCSESTSRQLPCVLDNLKLLMGPTWRVAKPSETVAFGIAITARRKKIHTGFCILNPASVKL